MDSCCPETENKYNFRFYFMLFIDDNISEMIDHCDSGNDIFNLMSPALLLNRYLHLRIAFDVCVFDVRYRISVPYNIFR